MKEGFPSDADPDHAVKDPCVPNGPRVGFPMHPYGNGQFDGTLPELFQIVRRYYHCDVKDEVAARLFGTEDTEARLERWAAANGLKVGHIDVLASWRFWW